MFMKRMTFLLALTSPASGFSQERTQILKSQIGAWGPVLPWNLIGIHAVLMPDKKVLTFGSNSRGDQGADMEYDVWDPSLGTGLESHTLLPNQTRTDIFCGAQLLLADSGLALISGGDIPGAVQQGNFDTNTFDTSTNRLTKSSYQMAYGRWYPTLTTLPTGEVIVQGGSNNGFAGSGVLTPEIFNTKTGWRSLFGAYSDYAYGNDFNRWWYPRSWVLNDGRLFSISGPAMYFVDYKDHGAIYPVGDFTGPNKGATSTAVMFEPGRILQVGGGEWANFEGQGMAGAKEASIIDLNGLFPTVTPAAPMHFHRHWATSTILPDGQILVTGGTALNATMGGDGPSYWPEIYNPKTNAWTVLAPEAHVRTYHSSALLLPDATVISMGGGAPGPATNLNAQILNPPYLFNGSDLASRPSYTLPDSSTGYGRSLAVNYQSDRPIERVTLVKTGAVTHSFNQDQRFVELSFTQGWGNTLSVTMPENSNIATPGFYLLFLIDSAGVPSKAEILRFLPL
ncbi:MAG: DUF1929 domain-containing protein [Proteobacteria bacterium]|nr:MAG: DUF1929 domain-containing protein [Pseudomonadota bacterium]